MKGERWLTAAVGGPVMVGAAFVALAQLTGSLWFMLLAGGCGGLILASLFVRHRLADLTLCLFGPSRVAVGDPVAQLLHVHNRGRRTSPPVLVTREVRGLDPVRIFVEPLPPGGVANVELTRPALSRGVTGVVRLRVDAGAPLGLVASARMVTFPRQLVVHPIRVAPDRGAVPRGVTDEAVDPRPGPGLDLAGVRDYRPGDDPRHVHWRSTARRGHLIVTERGTGSVRTLRMIVVGPSTAPDWEAVVARAAATCQAVQRDGGPILVATWAGLGPGIPAPGGTPAELLDWWAGQDIAELPDPDALVRTLGPGGSFVVAVSGLVPEGWWSRVRELSAAVGVDVVRLAVP